jgi:sporulation protein YlmC with PRC-barrel domain
MNEAKAVAIEKPAIMTLSDVQPLQRATHLIGLPVRNIDQSLQGEVKDIILNKDRTHAEFLAVRVAGLPDRIIPVPFGEARCTADGTTLVCNLEPRSTTLASGFEANKWPAEYAMRRVSTLLNLEIRDTSGQSVARLRDLLIDTFDLKVTEATVRVGGFLGVGERLASVAWNSVKLANNGEFAEILISQNTLRGIAYREREYWQHLGFGGKDTEPTVEHPKLESDWPATYPNF